MFFWNSLAFLMIQRCWQLDPSSSAFSKSSLKIWKFTVHVLLKPDLENFEHYFTSVWDGCNCAVVWAFFCIAFLWNWNENWPFPVLWPLLSFIYKCRYVYMDLLGAVLAKNPLVTAWAIRDMGSAPGLGGSPRGEHGNPLQYSCLKNSMDRGAWRATVYGSQRVKQDFFGWC